MNARPSDEPGQDPVADEPMCVAPAPVPDPAERGEPGAAEARGALRRARELAARGRNPEALIQLALVDTAMPRIRDRVALLRGELLMREGRAVEACRAYGVAVRTPDPATAARARVGIVRCSIARGDRTAGEQLTQLIRRYPELPEAAILRLELAEARERAGDRAGAASIYRAIDLETPGRPVAARARARLEALVAGGFHLRPLSDTQRVERAERLARGGPFDDARVELETLAARPLSPALRARVSVALARIARIEGNWAEAHRLVLAARNGAPPAPPEPIRSPGDGEEPEPTPAQQMAELQRDMEAASVRPDEAETRRAIRQLVGARGWDRAPTQRVLGALRLAARNGLTEPTDDALETLAARRGVQPAARFEAAVLAGGVGSDAQIVSVLEPILGSSALGVAARYHYARALERLGRYEEAEVQHLRVVAEDRSETRWYRMWSEQRLWAVRGAMVAAREWQGPTLLAALEGVPQAAPSPPRPVGVEMLEPEPEQGAEPNQDPEAPARIDLQDVARRLRPIAAAHGEAFPWIPRALDLIELGEVDAASDELHEAFVAWRQARGMPVPRTGVEAVYRLDSRPRVPQDPRTRRARVALDGPARETLANIAHQLGDVGTAVGFGGHRRAGARPRAYARLVEAAAARHGLDANLLFAVMRVESIYQRRVVSYAGAIGLMQIMPRTGALIADRLDRDDFTNESLLDPALNLEFAAWYLKSLIDRFDGNIALAIASYNGGPHNVRRWMADHDGRMPLEAFLERIPFEQTHRYVRRVLTHYAAYRAQQNLPMRELPVVLPTVGPDSTAF